MSEPVDTGVAARALQPPLREGSKADVPLGTDAALTIFEIVVAVMWSDGELIGAEVERGRGAAQAMDVNPTGGAFGYIADGAPAFSDIDFDALSEAERELAYAAAEWIDAANDAASERRTGFLNALRTRLGISDAAATSLRATARSAQGAPRVAFGELISRCGL